jgi:isoleucyl-tRNA synthetase
MNPDLARDMRAIRELVSLGLQVRTDNKLRVRQPLHRADMVVGSAAVAERLAAYDELVKDELNVHEVRWLLPGEEGEEVSYQLKPNFRALGPRVGKRVQDVKAALAAADARALRSELAEKGEIALDLPGGALTLTGAEVEVAVVAAPGFAAAGGKAGVVVVHTAVDQALLDEGLYREVLARVQAQRKELDLHYSARIRVAIHGGERMQRVVQTYADAISRETLAESIAIAALTGEEGEGWQAAEAQDERFAIQVART